MLSMFKKKKSIKLALADLAKYLTILAWQNSSYCARFFIGEAIVDWHMLFIGTLKKLCANGFNIPQP